MKSYAKFGYAAPFRFRVILEKPQGGAKMTPPPPGRRLTPAAESVPLLRPSGGNLIFITFPIYSVFVFDTSCSQLSNATFSVPL